MLVERFPESVLYYSDRANDGLVHCNREFKTPGCAMRDGGFEFGLRLGGFLVPGREFIHHPFCNG